MELTLEQRQAILDYINGEDSTSDVDELLYDRFWREMPYGVAKARTGDPEDWYADHLDMIADWIQAVYNVKTNEYELC